MANEKDIIAVDVPADGTQGNDTAVYQHTFKRPFSFEGKTYEKLTFDFGALTGKDSLRIEEELSSKGIAVIAPAFSAPYLARMAARACREKIDIDVLEAMPLKDYEAIRGKARTFLLRAD